MDLEKKRPKQVDEILQIPVKRYNIMQQREGIHLTDGIYCLRRAYFNKVDPLPPTAEEILYFLFGLGLQDALMGGDNQSVAEQDGIIISPDYWEDGVLGELKTTRMTEKSINEKGIPEGWQRQMMGYAYVLGVDKALLVILPIIRPDVLSYVLTFTPEELATNWEYISDRIGILKQGLDEGIVPVGDADWQCKNCRYSLRCKVGGKK
jgi:hypothetical protein